ETVPLLSEATTSLVHVNSNLERVDVITTNVQAVTTNASALTPVIAATLGGPLVKVAAFSYGVRRALRDSDSKSHEVRRAVRSELRAQERGRRYGRGQGAAGSFCWGSRSQRPPVCSSSDG